MTTGELIADQKRIAIAKCLPGICTTDIDGLPVWLDRSPEQRFDPLLDLNAMREAEKTLTDEQRRKWGEIVVEMTNNFPSQHIVLYLKNPIGGESIFGVSSLTAAQRAEAFGKTLNLW